LWITSKIIVVINLNLGPLSKYPIQEEQKPDEDRYKKECNNGAVKSSLSLFRTIMLLLNRH